MIECRVHIRLAGYYSLISYWVSREQDSLIELFDFWSIFRVSATYKNLYSYNKLQIVSFRLFHLLSPAIHILRN